MSPNSLLPQHPSSIVTYEIVPHTFTVFTKQAVDKIVPQSDSREGGIYQDREIEKDIFLDLEKHFSKLDYMTFFKEISSLGVKSIDPKDKNANILTNLTNIVQYYSSFFLERYNIVNGKIVADKSNGEPINPNLFLPFHVIDELDDDMKDIFSIFFLTNKDNIKNPTYKIFPEMIFGQKQKLLDLIKILNELHAFGVDLDLSKDQLSKIQTQGKDNFQSINILFTFLDNNQFQDFFSEGEIVSIKKLLYCIYITLSILVQKYDVNSIKNYNSELLGLIVLIYRYNVSLTHIQNQSGSVDNYVRIYEYVFGYRFNEEDIKYFHNSKIFEKIVKSDSTVQEKKNLSSIIIGMGRQYVGKFDPSDINSLYDYFSEHFKSDEKIGRIVRFFLTDEKKKYSFERLLFILKNDLESLSYIHQLHNGAWIFLENYIKNGYSKDFLHTLDIHTFKKVSSFDGNIVGFLSEGKESIEDAQNGVIIIEKYKRILKNIPNCELGDSIIPVLSDYKGHKILDTFYKECEEKYPFLEAYSNDVSRFVKIDEDREILWSYYNTIGIQKNHNTIISQLFLLPCNEKSVFLSLFQRTKGTDYFAYVSDNIQTLKTSGYFTELKECLDDSIFGNTFLLEILETIKNENTTQSQEITQTKDISFSEVEGINKIEIKFLNNLSNHEIKKECFEILSILSSNNAKSQFVKFLQSQKDIQIQGLKNIFALLKFFKSFKINNFSKIDKLFKFCTENEGIHERISFLYERIRNYEIDSGEDEDFKAVIMKYIKNSDKKEIDEYFFTQEELNIFDISEYNSSLKDGVIRPIPLREFVRKVGAIGYKEITGNGGSHIKYVHERNTITITKNNRNKERMNKTSIVQILRLENMKLSEWNEL